MGAIDQVAKIKRELAEFDLAQSSCPVDRRRAEKEAERKAIATREVEQSRETTNWARWIDERIIQHLKRYFMSGDEENPGLLTLAIGQVMGENRALARKELKAAVADAEKRLAAKLVELEERLKSVPGKLPVAKAWRQESVTYQAEMVCHKGSLWQARKDTAQRPGGEDWILIARHGRDAITPTLRGLFDSNEAYAQLDVVEFEGASYLAKHDNPGVPGHDDGWQVLSKRGARGRRGETIRGPQGEKGVRGDKGESALQIVSWHIDGPNYRAVPFMSNGQPGPELDLRPLFLQLLQEVGSVDYAWGP